MFQINKKILKQKADEELKESFMPILERRQKILETIIDLKEKIYKDLQKKRLQARFN